MEFLDEYESKPRFLFQSKHLDEPPHPSSSSSLHKLALFISISLSLLTCTLAFLYFNSEPLNSLLFWVSISLLVGPFAPPSLTGGDIRVGVGPPIKEIPMTPPSETNRKSTKSTKKASEDGVRSSEKPIAASQSSGSNKSNGPLIEEKWEEWSEVDDEMLKKLMGKHPVGKPGRWEAIADGFKGKHKVETVISKAKAKANANAKEIGDQDSYKKFLKDRKPMDQRSAFVDDNAESESGWSSAEDLALLNALKAFPKEVAMRWEKVASSVPGKTKAACVKRMAELKKDFRSSKAGQAS